MPPLAVSWFADANYLEAALWTSMAAVALVQSVRLNGASRRQALLLAFTLAAFGGSDVVEAATGAWWHPWWLLVWKGLCLAAFLLIGLDHWRRKRPVRMQPPSPNDVHASHDREGADEGPC